MQLPAAAMCTVLPLTVQVPVVWLLKLTASPDEAVALTTKSGSPKVFALSAPNVIVWPAFVISAVVAAVVDPS